MSIRNIFLTSNHFWLTVHLKRRPHHPLEIEENVMTPYLHVPTCIKTTSLFVNSNELLINVLLIT